MSMDIGVGQTNSESHCDSCPWPYSLRNTVVKAYQETCSDLSIDKPNLTLGILFMLWIFGLLLALGFLTLFGVLPSLSLDSTHPSACHPDGTFSPFGQTYNPWAFVGFFQINLAFGSLTFTDVKVIDVFWDIVIGRGGQAVMAFVSWRVFADYIATSMVTKPITYLTFRVAFLETSPSLASTYRLARDVLSRRGLDSKFATIFIIWSMLFILGWPTISSAATGYTPTTEPFILTFDHNFVAFSYFQPLAYVIHDGSRVGLTADYQVPLFGGQYPGDPITYSHTSFRFAHEYICGRYMRSYYEGEDCQLQVAVSTYTSTYGFYDTYPDGFRGANITTNWLLPNGSLTQLPSPSLYIEAFSVAPENWEEGENGLYGWGWTNRGPEHGTPFSNRSRTSWTYSNQMYSLSYIKDNGQCQPVKNTFKWGFSFLQIFIIVIALLVWTMGTCLLWLKSHFRLPFQDHLEVPRGYKPLLLLAQTIDHQFDAVGFDVHSLTNKQLKTEIRRSPGEESISLKGSFNTSTFWDWFAEDWPWFLAIAIGLIVTIALSAIQVVSVSQIFQANPPATISEANGRIGVMLHTPLGNSLWWIFNIFTFSSLGLMLALIIGKSTRTRIFVVSCSTSIGLLGVTIPVYMSLYAGHLFKSTNTSEM